MRTLVSILGVLVAVAFIMIAALMNWRYGTSLGRSADDQLLFAAAGLAVDVAKILMPFFCWWAFENRRWIAGSLASIALIGCVGYSVAGIAGFVDLARATTTGTLVAKRDRAEALRGELQRKQSSMNALGVVEPMAVIERKLETARQDVRWRTSRECTDATVPASRDYCKEYRGLETQKESSVAAGILERDMAELRRALDQLAGVTQIDRGDPRAGFLSRLTGLEILWVQTSLSLLFVAIVEFMSTFGIFIALNHGAVASALRREPPGSVHVKQHTKSASQPLTLVIERDPIMIENAIRAEPATSLEHIAKFAVNCMQPREGARVLVASLYPTYCRWCASLSMEPAVRETFMSSFVELCKQSGFVVVQDGDVLVAEGFVVVA